MRVGLVFLGVSVAALAVACSSSKSTFGDDDSGLPNDDGGTGDVMTFPSPDGNPGLNEGGPGGDASMGGVSVIYAHTDCELYTMDPSTKKITDIGAFDDGTGAATACGGTGMTPVVTDLAVNSAGDVWVNTETAIYKAAVPTTPGPVKITMVASITAATGQKFYALGFAPAGVLGSGETLVAGDNKGELYSVESTGTTKDLGNFGTDGAGGTYELSGDVVFYTQNMKARGLATVRLYKKGSPTSENDILAEIDVAAMSSAYMSGMPAATLKKQFIGTGTTFGRLYGVGAWNDSVYAFSRAYTNTAKAMVPAQLIQIDGTGTGTSLMAFPAITAGFSGAGVTTSATVTVLPPN